MTDDDAKLLVERVGPLATIQDLGRPGWFDSGVGVAGAADRGALRLANRLVGNPEDHAGIEVLLGGVRLRTMRHTTLAVTGAPAPVTVDGRPVGHASVLELEPDQVVSLGLASTGLRSYIGVRGGIDVAPVLGSRSRDTMSGIGPDPLRPGDEVPIGPAPRTFPILDLAPLPNLPVLLDIRAVPGPRDDWFTDPAALFMRQLDGQRRRRPGRCSVTPRIRPAAGTFSYTGTSDRRRRARRHPGAARRAAGGVSRRSSDHRRLSGDRGGGRCRYRSDGAGAAGPERAVPARLIRADRGGRA